MSFAVRVALRAPLAVAIVAAVGWGLAIMILDRMLVVSLQQPEHWWSYFLLALPRIAFALLLGFIISIPFTLEIFAPEISAQVAIIHQQTWNAYLDSQSQATAGLQQKITRDEATIATGVPPGTAANQTIPGLRSQLATLQADAMVAFDNWQCQLYGGANCPDQGNGTVAQAAHEHYQSDEDQIKSLNGQIAQDEATAQSSATTEHKDAIAQLATDQAKLKNEQAQQARDAIAFKKVNDANDGLLIRVRALDQVTESDSDAANTHLAFFLLFATIECLPVLVKILLSARKRNVYDTAVTVDEAARLKGFTDESTTNAADQAAERKATSHAWQNLLSQVAAETTAARLAARRAGLREQHTGGPPAGRGKQSGRAQPLAAPAPPWKPAAAGPGRQPRPRSLRTNGHAGATRRGHQPPSAVSGEPGLPGTYSADHDEPLTILREPPP